MQKRILAILLSVTGFCPVLSYALGLGDIEVFSALNQPLTAEITLTSVRPGEADGMLVKLAPEDAFQQAGVERPYHLTKLVFNVVAKADGSQVISVTTTNPVREPFLSFLVDVDWPRGRLVREYTILLDPPVFASHSQTTAPTQQSTEPSAEASDVTSVAGAPALIERDSVTVADDDFGFDDGAVEALDESTDAVWSEPVDDFGFAETGETSSLELPDIEITAAAATTDADESISSDEEVLLDTAAGEDDFSFDESTVESFDAEDLSDEALALETSEGRDFVGDSEDWLAEDDLVDETSMVEDSIEEFEEEPGDKIEYVDDAEIEDFDSEQLLAPARSTGFPDIVLAFDANLPYDEAATNALLAQFAAEDDVRLKDAKEHEVQAGDALYEVASRYKAPDVTVDQAMLAILRYNPDAFIRDNINNVRKGFVLRIPDRDSMLQIDSSEALAEVQRQHALWREYRTQLAGAPTTVRDAQLADERLISERTSSESESSGGELTILSPGRDAEATDRVTGAQDGTESGQSVLRELQLAREELAAEKLKNQELSERTVLLADRVEKQERALLLYNEKLAQVQQALAEAEAKNAEIAADETIREVESDLGLTLQGEEPGSTEEIGDTSDAGVAESDTATADTEVAGSETSVDIVDTSDEFALDAGTDTVDESVESGADENADTGHDLSSLDDFDDFEFENDIKVGDGDASSDSDSADAISESATEIGFEEENIDLLAEEPSDEAVEVADTASAVETVSEAAAAAETEVEEEVPAPPEPPKHTGLAGFFYDLLEGYPPYNHMVANALDSYVGQGILAIVLLILILGLYAVVKPKKGKASKPSGIIAAATPEDAKVSKPVKASFDDRLSAMFAPITGLFGKRSKGTLDTSAVMDSEAAPYIEDSNDSAEQEDEAIVEDLGEIESFDEPAQAAAQESADEEESQFDKTTITSSMPVAAPETPQEELSDDTTQEADVYLAYGLHDQAEELLSQAIATHPDKAVDYKGKLLETYFAAAKKTEFEQLASDVKASLRGRSSRVWDKTVAMGKEIAPDNALFSDASAAGLKVEDFAPAKPQTADLDLSEASGSTTPDIDFGTEEPASTTTDFDLDLGDDDDDSTIISGPSGGGGESTDLIDLDAVGSEGDDSNLEFDLAADSDDMGSELDIDFNADELGLDTEVDLDASFEDSESDDDSTVAIDLAFDIDDEASDGADDESYAIELDVDLDDMKGSDSTDFEFDNTASDDLIADLDLGDEPILGESSDDTEFEIPEDDDTIIDADLDDETISGDSGVDEVATKLDLAKAYMDMGDHDGASSTLEEVMAEGSEGQRQEAEELLDQIN